MLDAPFSLEALEFARRAAAAKYTYPDDRLALRDLLSRWNMGLDMTRSERRMALRIAREQAAIELPDLGAEQPVSQLASVRKVLEAPEQPPGADEDARYQGAGWRGRGRRRPRKSWTSSAPRAREARILAATPTTTSTPRPSRTRMTTKRGRAAPAGHLTPRPT